MLKRRSLLIRIGADPGTGLVDWKTSLTVSPEPSIRVRSNDPPPRRGFPPAVREDVATAEVDGVAAGSGAGAVPIGDRQTRKGHRRRALDVEDPAGVIAADPNRWTRGKGVMRTSSPAAVGQQVVDLGLPANRCQGGVLDHAVVFGESQIGHLSGPFHK
jgi:hypothetical protein